MTLRVALVSMVLATACAPGGSDALGDGEGESTTTDGLPRPDLAADVPDECAPLPGLTAERTLWRRVFEVSLDETPVDVTTLSDGTVVVLGRAGPTTNVVSLHDDTGEFVLSFEEEFVGILDTAVAIPDGGFALAGRRDDAAVVRTYDGDGAFRWEAQISEPPLSGYYLGESIETAEGIAFNPEGVGVVFGISRAAGGDGENAPVTWLAWISADGVPGSAWDVDGPSPNATHVLSGAADGTFFMAGDRYSHFWAAKYESGTAALWQFTESGDPHPVPHAVVPLADGGAFVGGVARLSGKDSDALLGRISPDGEKLWLDRIGFCGDDKFLTEQAVNFGGSVVFLQSHQADPDDPSTYSVIARAFDGSGDELWAEPVPFEPGATGFKVLLTAYADQALIVGEAALPSGGYFLSAIDLK